MDRRTSSATALTWMQETVLRELRDGHDPYANRYLSARHVTRALRELRAFGLVESDDDGWRITR